MQVDIVQLKSFLAEQYLRQSTKDDPAWDFLNPAAQTLLLPFVEVPRPHLFYEYFNYVSRRERVSLEGPCGPVFTWPIPPDCPRVEGERGSFGLPFQQLFIGDLVWLFYHERMGVHRMLGALLDDFVTKGRFPIRPSGVSGLLLETMVRELKSGLSTTTRERCTSYARCLGWKGEACNKLEMEAPKNAAFNVQFHRLVYLALGYYQEKRLAVAIQNSTTAGKPSVATLTSIRDTIVLLRKSFDPFKYGRNHTHTLSGIVYTLSAFYLFAQLRSQLGIPEPYDREDELIPAVYDLLIPGGGASGDVNRFTTHRDCAEKGRNLLLDVQGMDFTALPPGVGAEDVVEAWLLQVESTFETYRTAYRALTGVDLGQSGASIEQQA